LEKKSMKSFIALAAAAAVLVSQASLSPAAAQAEIYGATNSKVEAKPTQARVRAQTNLIAPQQANEIVCIDGKRIGTDPDPWMRDELRRECEQVND
jgi:hypothetical protein